LKNSAWVVTCRAELIERIQRGKSPDNESRLNSGRQSPTLNPYGDDHTQARQRSVSSAMSNPGAKTYERPEAERLYWVHYQLTMKRSMLQLFLRTFGNLLFAMTPDASGKGRSTSVFDFDKYLAAVSQEMPENLEFVRAITGTQGFHMLVEDLHQAANAKSAVPHSTRVYLSCLRDLNEQSVMEGLGAQGVKYASQQLKAAMRSRGKL
jgi:hypothetical protein